MTVRELRRRAALCRSVEGLDGLDALFVNQSRYPFDGPAPRWGELQRIYSEAVQRITQGDASTGEVLEGYPF
jgi:hypothetical protein